MNDLALLGPRWTLERAVLWIRYRDVADVLRFSGVHRDLEADGVLGGEEAETELLLALVSGEIRARGVCQVPSFGTVSSEEGEIPTDVWTSAVWGPDHIRERPSFVVWEHVELPAAAVVAKWPIRVRAMRGRKSGLPFPADELRARLKKEFHTGDLRDADDPGMIARRLERAGFAPEFKYQTIRDRVIRAIEELREERVKREGQGRS